MQLAGMTSHYRIRLCKLIQSFSNFHKLMQIFVKLNKHVQNGGAEQYVQLISKLCAKLGKVLQCFAKICKVVQSCAKLSKVVKGWVELGIVIQKLKPSKSLKIH